MNFFEEMQDMWNKGKEAVDNAVGNFFDPVNKTYEGAREWAFGKDSLWSDTVGQDSEIGKFANKYGLPIALIVAAPYLIEALPGGASVANTINALPKEVINSAKTAIDLGGGIVNTTKDILNVAKPIIDPVTGFAIDTGKAVMTSLLGKKNDQNSTTEEKGIIDSIIDFASSNPNLANSLLNTGVGALQTGLNQQAIGESGQIANTGIDTAISSLRTGYDQANKSMQPYSEAGKSALSQYQELLKKGAPIYKAPTNLELDPIYNQGTNLLNQQMAKMGLTQSPTGVIAGQSPLIAQLYGRAVDTSKDIYNSELNAFNAGMSGLNNLSNIGYNALNTENQANIDLSKQISNYDILKAQNQAKVKLGQAPDYSWLNNLKLAGGK